MAGTPHEAEQICIRIRTGLKTGKADWFSSPENWSLSLYNSMMRSTAMIADDGFSRQASGNWMRNQTRFLISALLKAGSVKNFSMGDRTAVAPISWNRSPGRVQKGAAARKKEAKKRYLSSFRHRLCRSRGAYSIVPGAGMKLSKLGSITGAWKSPLLLPDLGCLPSGVLR